MEMGEQLYLEPLKTVPSRSAFHYSGQIILNFLSNISDLNQLFTCACLIILTNGRKTYQDDMEIKKVIIPIQIARYFQGCFSERKESLHRFVSCSPGTYQDDQLALKRTKSRYIH